MRWDELRAHVRDRRTVLADQGERLMIVVSYSDPASGDIEQRVELSRVDMLGRPWLLLLADACPLSDITPHRALIHNATLAIGAIVIEEHHYFLRHATPLDPMTPEILDLVVDLLAHEAARLRARRPLAPAPRLAADDQYAE